MRHYRTVLVTGCPRSGTTPVGTNLALAAGAQYLYEPFNPSYGLRAITRYYQVPGADGFSPGDLDACVQAIRTLRLDLRSYAGRHDTGWRRRIKRLIGGRAHLSYWRCRLDWTLDTIIWKDPIACLSTAAVVDRHRLPVVVTVRPAAAVAASYKRLDWDPGVASVLDSLAQLGIEYPQLRRRWLDSAEEPAIGAALLWTVLYTTLLEWAESRPLMRFLSLQASLDDPVPVYRDLYRWLELPWSERVERELLREAQKGRTGPSANHQPLPARAHVGRRRLDEINTYGRRLLTATEAGMIEEMTGELWLRLQASCDRHGGGAAAPTPNESGPSGRYGSPDHPLQKSD
jgi:hypothetical protein